MGERVSIDTVKVDLENAFTMWHEECWADDEKWVEAARARVNAFLAQVEADRKQAESVLASFNLARHALASIYEMVNLGDPGRNPEVLMRIEYAVEEAMTQAEKQTAN